MVNGRMTGYDRALVGLRTMTTELAVAVRVHLGKAIDILEKKDLQFDYRKSDQELDQKRDVIVNRSFDMISLQQPRPRELRSILGFQRIAQELERIADYACDLVELNDLRTSQEWPTQILEMSKQLLNMFDFNLAILKEEKAIDRDLDQQDDVIDQIYAQLQADLLKGNKQGTDAESGLILIMARTLERMGDHVVNIAEMLLYVETGQRRLGKE
ncbi:MAG: PhoU domain-containing protein [Desulfitobacteriaceae bacterium]